jgi:hypothetical protein
MCVSVNEKGVETRQVLDTYLVTKHSAYFAIS